MALYVELVKDVWRRESNMPQSHVDIVLIPIPKKDDLNRRGSFV